MMSPVPQATRPSRASGLSQSELDSAYAVKLFLDHHPGRLSLAALAAAVGLSDAQLVRVFAALFQEDLEEYRLRREREKA
jgi:AraC-like DNA-binding protein